MDDAFGVLATTSIGLIVFFGIIAIAFYVVYVIALAKLFKKAGEDGWKAIIPFYNVFVLIQIAGLNWWYFLIAISGTICTIAKIDGLNYICNLAGMAVNFFVFYNIAKKNETATSRIWCSWCTSCPNNNNDIRIFRQIYF